jgi:hypothetical protein
LLLNQTSAVSFNLFIRHPAIPTRSALSERGTSKESGARLVMSDRVETFEPYTYEAAPGDKRTAGQVATPSTPRDAGAKTRPTLLTMPDTSKLAADAPSIRVGSLVIRQRIEDGPWHHSDTYEVLVDASTKPLRGDAAVAVVFAELQATAAPAKAKAAR